MCHPYRITTLADRLAIRTLAEAGHPDAAIAQQLGWSIATVRKWRRRARAGPDALVSHLGRPRQGPWVPHTLKDRQRQETVRRWRTQHPGWGAKTLQAELARDPSLGGTPLPSRATLARFLKAAGFTRRYHRQIAPAQPARPRPAAPHEEWEMDARGHEAVPDVGLVSLIQINDRCSHARLLSSPCVLGATHLERRLGLADYQLALRLAFTEWGLPDRLVVDHETVFADPDSSSPFPTRFQLWLAALGVDLAFIRVRRPTDQGLTERSHQLWEAQVVRGQTFANAAALYQALRERRPFLNEQLPCRSLGDRPPLVAYPAAARPRRAYRPEWEATLLDVGRLRALLAGGQWARRVSKNGAIRLGNQVYPLGQAWEAGSEVELTYDPTEGVAGTLVITSADRQRQRRHALRGVTPEALMGDLAQIVNVPGYQPCLPFSWTEERVLRLCALRGDTCS